MFTQGKFLEGWKRSSFYSFQQSNSLNGTLTILYILLYVNYISMKILNLSAYAPVTLTVIYTMHLHQHIEVVFFVKMHRKNIYCDTSSVILNIMEYFQNNWKKFLCDPQVHFRSFNNPEWLRKIFLGGRDYTVIYHIWTD